MSTTTRVGPLTTWAVAATSGPRMRDHPAEHRFEVLDLNELDHARKLDGEPTGTGVRVDGRVDRCVDGGGTAHRAR